ncbi:PadR family transcriptional regulator [Solwaraspora sp. WMMD406]|uniref:PadR family transcriptional regulator n=1 Tax=Solwaraspora sp. WMMD406 TaxID=3016095 RepID=UPI0024172253|nr:PadR family transcriptional regulator [Solwaraspora sp. WMMD406]MDG4767871.1 PadR family transcriptional regulator [Solwaraspora sp. WMMD406]
MSATRMMILGLVKWMQPVHGYDVRRELLSWGADAWANIQPGSIYHALRTLAQDGLLRTVGTAQVGARPARTSYEITPTGIDEFETLLRQHWRDCRPPVDPFLSAFAFLPAMPRAEAVSALRGRAAALRGGNVAARAELTTGWARHKPAHVGWMLELTIARAEGEVAWCERVADLIESGVPYQPGSAVDKSADESWSGWQADLDRDERDRGERDRAGDNQD